MRAYTGFPPQPYSSRSYGVAVIPRGITATPLNYGQCWNRGSLRVPPGNRDFFSRLTPETPGDRERVIAGTLYICTHSMHSMHSMHSQCTKCMRSMHWECMELMHFLTAKGIPLGFCAAAEDSCEFFKIPRNSATGPENELFGHQTLCCKFIPPGG